MPRSNSRTAGTKGEQIAEQYLRDQGLQIVEMNYRYGRGEIDIVARDGDVLVFCEVKTRYNDKFGPPECAITPRKQQQMRKVAEAYLYDNDIHEQDCRFDVVAIRMHGNRPEINYIPDAFW